MRKYIVVTCGLVTLGGAFAAACSGDDSTTPTNDAGADVTVDGNGTHDAIAPADAADAGTDAGDASHVDATPPTPSEQGLAISPVPIPTAGLTSDQIAQLGLGSYLVNAVSACGDCHTPGGPPPLKFLAGGTPFPIDGTNVVYARNLTPDPTGLALGESAFINAMRTGRDYLATNEILIVMPWQHFRWMSTADLKAIYAYLKVIPAVTNVIPPDVKTTSVLNGPYGAPPTSYDEGDVVRPLPPEGDAGAGDGGASDAAAPPDPDNAQRGLLIRPLDEPKNLATLSAADQAKIGRGAYLVNGGQCNDCHTNPSRISLTPGAASYLKIDTSIYLTGGRTFAVPAPLQAQLHQVRTMSADLTGTTTGFFNEADTTLARFVAIITTGTHADESIDGGPARALGWPMPWATFKNMVPSDLEAVYAYVKTIPGRTDKQTEDYARYCTKDGDCDTSAGETCSKATLADAALAPSGECVGQACTPATVAESCNACQECTGGGNTKCVVPSAASSCVVNGL